ncbi:DsbA family protein [Enterobacteriaceae bacterium BIT-l23]|uniref:DsbA family protein n=1 Tax=Jejubacter sp. L23 TaxID=3092086 RepID=UPI001585AA29|nr:DsbA family protein [Enterobacteriaceae bacterium BIT-l23]
MMILGYVKSAAGLMLLLSLCSLPVRAATSPAPEAGREYTVLTSPVTPAPRVVEFFSFYCGHCRLFAERYPVRQTINRVLPSDTRVVRYHVSAMGPLGRELTEAWGMAVVLNKTDAVERLLFAAVQNGTVQTADDIRHLLAKAGIDEGRYLQASHSPAVQAEVARQSKAVVEYDVRGVPAFYIDGKYHINNAGISGDTPADYVSHFTRVVTSLLQY